MKIEYIKGDLFSTNIKHICHGVNCQKVMASGVAKIIRDLYPLAYSEYKKFDMKLGDVQFIDCGSKIIINAATQDTFGRTSHRYVSYDAVANCMLKINERFASTPNGKLSMPQIGAGLGNGSWSVIEAIIESELTNVQPVVYVL